MVESFENHALKTTPCEPWLGVAPKGLVGVRYPRLDRLCKKCVRCDTALAYVNPAAKLARPPRTINDFDTSRLYNYR